MLAYLLLVAAQAPVEMPNFDAQATKTYCVADEPDEIDNQFACVRYQLEAYNRFAIHVALDDQNRSALMGCLARDRGDEEGLDWRMIVSCADDLVSPDEEQKQYPNSFTIARAQKMCKKGDSIYGPLEESAAVRDCMQDQAAGHHSFALMKKAVQTGSYKIDPKYVENCHATWVKQEDRYDWIMAEYCLTKQFGGDYFLKLMQ